MVSILTSNFGSDLDSEAIGSAPTVIFGDEKNVFIALKVTTPGTSKYIVELFLNVCLLVKRVKNLLHYIQAH
jgi:hypothetical protein